MKIAISSGHGKYIRGASGSPVPPELDEVDEARRVVDRVAELLHTSGIDVETFHDNISHDQSTNLSTIVNWHNNTAFGGDSHDLDVSVHFNAYNGSANGVEVLYVTQETLAGVMSQAIADAGPFTNRGPKYRNDLYFLGNTQEPAVLIETCFCDNTPDSETFTAKFDQICEAIAESLSGRDVPDEAPPERPPVEIPIGRNRVEINTTITGDVTSYVNGTLIRGHEPCEHKVEYTVSLHGDVTLVVNGEDFHNRL